MGSKEDMERVVKRTAEMMAVFTKNYLAALVASKIKGLITNSVDAAMAKVNAAKEQVVGKPKEGPQEVSIPDDKGLVVMGVTDHNRDWDYDGSTFTTYTVCGAYIQAGQSRLRAVRKRYRLLLRLHNDLQKESKDKKQFTYPKDIKFPAKKAFGNMDHAFIKQRQEELNTWMQTLVNSEVGTTDSFLKAFDLKHDPDAETNRELFISAFNKTCDNMNVWVWEDPSDFEDEGQALTVLMIYICRREFFPEIEAKIWNTIKVHSLARKAINTMRGTLSKAVNKAVMAAWEACRPIFKQTKEMFEEKWKDIESQLLDVIGKVVDGILGKILEKLPKQELPKADEAAEDKKEEDEDKWPGITKLAAASNLISAMKEMETSTPALKSFYEELAKPLPFQRKLVRQVNAFIREVPDYWLQWTMRRLLDAVEGVVDLFHVQVQRTANYLIPFFTARDDIEAKFAKIAGDGSKNADACKTEAKADIEALDKTLADELKKIGVRMGGTIYHDRSNLRWKIRELTTKAGSGLMDLVTELPEKELNMLAAFRVQLVAALPTAFDAGTKPAEVQLAVRNIFLQTGASVFDPFFRVIWAQIVEQTRLAAQVTCVDKLYDIVQPILKACLEGLGNLMPDALSKMVDLPAMADMIALKALEGGAGAAVNYFKKKLEAAMFAPDPKMSAEEEEALKKAEAERNAKAEEDRKKKEEEDKKYKPTD